MPADTCRDNKKNGPPGGVTAPCGPFSQVIAGARFELSNELQYATLEIVVTRILRILFILMELKKCSNNNSYPGDK